MTASCLVACVLLQVCVVLPCYQLRSLMRALRRAATTATVITMTITTIMTSTTATTSCAPRRCCLCVSRCLPLDLVQFRAAYTQKLALTQKSFLLLISASLHTLHIHFRYAHTWQEKL